MTTKATATTTSEVHIIARIQFKNDARKVCYQVASSNGKDTYTTCLFNGKGCSCTCPARTFCKHQRACEAKEATRTPAQVAEPVVVETRTPERATYSTAQEREKASLSSNRAFSFMR